MNNLDNLKISINCHSSICLDERIYIDPYKVGEGQRKADIIFITHPHYDHLDKLSIVRIMTNRTVFVCPIDCVLPLMEIGVKPSQIVEVEPNQEFDVLDVGVKTFPAYNTLSKYHERKNNWVGYELEVEGVKCLICGDSDRTDELMKRKCDVMFVPIGGTYTMDAKEAAKLVNAVMPKLVIPVHYLEIVGNKEDEKQFIDGLDKKIKCKILVGK